MKLNEGFIRLFRKICVFKICYQTVVNFTNMFTRSFYAQRTTFPHSPNSIKRQLIKLTFYWQLLQTRISKVQKRTDLLGSLRIKTARKHVGEINPTSGLPKQHFCNLIWFFDLSRSNLITTYSTEFVNDKFYFETSYPKTNRKFCRT